MIKDQIAYRFYFFLSSLSIFGQVLFAWLIWGAVFQGRDYVGGFSLQTMLLYYVISSYLFTLDEWSSAGGEVPHRIRGGSFSKFMVIPVNPLHNFLSQTIGLIGFYSVFALPIALLSWFLFDAGVLWPTFPAVIVAVLIIISGVVFMVSYHFFIGVLAFKFQDVTFFLMLQTNILHFTQGGLIPLNLLPQGVVDIMLFLPFPHVVFTPTMLLIGEMAIEEGFKYLAVILAWTVFMYALSQLTYNRLRVKYDGVGI